MERAMVPSCKTDLVYRPLEMPLEPMEFLTYSRSLQSFNTFESSDSTLQNSRRRQSYIDEQIIGGIPGSWVLVLITEPETFLRPGDKALRAYQETSVPLHSDISGFEQRHLDSGGASARLQIRKED
ncbi:hypothetical protein F2Q69_00033843 [Brassica cretica]|uniref:Uncharacterized protein n=1 Tax=Brassica cretica TaxID=69181 RepID=A0A8S9SA78_BRACR|nr:hypothetical protein F2Q69_00033843 [Brassica cretica]